jgi:murein L,D-transpeptidase YcbB/YkuD
MLENRDASRGFCMGVRETGTLRIGHKFLCGIVAFCCHLAAVPAVAQAVAPSGVIAEVSPGALRDQLAAVLDPARAEDRAIAAFYGTRGHAPLWLDNPERRTALAAALLAAPSHALPDRSSSLPAEAATPAAELAFTRAFLRHARAVSSGLLDPRRVSPEITRAPVRPADVELLAGLAAAPDPAAYLGGIAPADPGYEALRGLHARFAALPPAAWGAPVPAGPTLRLGDRDARVGLLRARLAAMGDFAGAATGPDAMLYDAPLAAAVEAFQRRHGLNDDGAVGPMTLAALNASPAARAAQIAVNLERMRWLNHPLVHRRLVVNQAGFTVTLYEGDAVLFHERVIIGLPDRQTPEFSDQMTYLVFNPTWFVPRSIATRDILPKLHADPTYLARSNMVLTRADGGPVPYDPSFHDFTAYDSRSFPYRIRQRPDPENALGQVKFMFPNNHAVYLHDTPTRSLFNRDSRAYSSGCVRVRDPLRLAALLLAAQYDDPVQAIDAMILNGRERHVTLAEPVPVHLTYRTAWVDDAGQPQFRADIYRRDAAVVQALVAAGVAAGE